MHILNPKMILFQAIRIRFIPFIAHFLKLVFLFFLLQHSHAQQLTTQRAIVQEWDFESDAQSNNSLEFNWPDGTDNKTVSGGAYRMNGNDGVNDGVGQGFISLGSIDSGKLTYSITLKSWELSDAASSFWEVVFYDATGQVSKHKIITQYKTTDVNGVEVPFYATAVYTQYQGDNGVWSDSFKVGKFNNSYASAGNSGNPFTDFGAYSYNNGNLPVTVNFRIDLDNGTYAVWVGDGEPSDDDGMLWGIYGGDSPVNSGSIPGGFDRTITKARTQFKIKDGALNSGDEFIEVDNISFYTDAPPITEEQRIEDNIKDMAQEAMQPNFWLNPADNGAIGRVCYAFGSYYLNQNTDVADNYLLGLHHGDATKDAEMDWEKIYFQRPLLLRFLLDERFSENMSDEVKEHLLSLFYSRLEDKNASYESDSSKDKGWWERLASENHNATRRSVDYLAALALSQSDTYKDHSFSDGSTVASRVVAGEDYWKSYFVGRAQKGLETEIHSPTYTKYTLQCYYNILDLSSNADLRKMAELYMHLYWADIAQHFIAENSVVGGSMTRVYKKYINRQFNQYPRHVTAQFGWTDVGVSVHPGDFVGLVTDYRVPEIISNIATEPRSEGFLLQNKSWGIAPDKDNNSADLKFLDPGPVGGSGGALRQSYVTDSYVMGTTLYDIQKDFGDGVSQNRAMGVYFSNENDRILINGFSNTLPRPPGEERKGYRDVTGVTGNNCMVAWRPSKHKTYNAEGFQIFLNNALKDSGSFNGDWWFCEVGEAYVAMRAVTGEWDWFPEEELNSGGNPLSDGGYFRLDDPDSPIIIECANASEYNSFEAFQEDIKDNSFSFQNNELEYISSSGELFKTFKKNDTAYPQIYKAVFSEPGASSTLKTVLHEWDFEKNTLSNNGLEFNWKPKSLGDIFNPLQTYTSRHLNGITEASPYLVTISNDDATLTLDFENLTETNSSLSSKGLSKSSISKATTDSSSIPVTSSMGSYRVQGDDSESDFVNIGNVDSGKLTYSIGLKSWELSAKDGAYWQLEFFDSADNGLARYRIISQDKSGYVATSVYTMYKDSGVWGSFKKVGRLNTWHTSDGDQQNNGDGAYANNLPVQVNFTLDLDDDTYTIWVGDGLPSDDDGSLWGIYGGNNPLNTGSVDLGTGVSKLKWSWVTKSDAPNAGDEFIEIDKISIYAEKKDISLSAKPEKGKKEYPKIYPTVNRGTFNIALENKTPTLLEVYDLTGALILSKKVSEKQTTIILPNKVQGMYFVNLSQNGQKIGQNKIIVK